MEARSPRDFYPISSFLECEIRFPDSGAKIAKMSYRYCDDDQFLACFVEYFKVAQILPASLLSLSLFLSFSMKKRCKGQKKILSFGHGKSFDGVLIKSSQATWIRVDRLRAFFLFLSPTTDALSLLLSPPLFLFLRKDSHRVIYLNKPLDKKSTHDLSLPPPPPPSRRRRRGRSATCINNFADTSRINRARAPRSPATYSVILAETRHEFVMTRVDRRRRLYRFNYRALFRAYLFATRYARYKIACCR